MDISRAFGKVLRSARQKKGLSQEALALNCDLDRTFISLLERGLRQPSLETIFKVAGELEISAADLVAAVEANLPRRSSRR